MVANSNVGVLACREFIAKIIYSVGSQRLGFIPFFDISTIGKCWTFFSHKLIFPLMPQMDSCHHSQERPSVKIHGDFYPIMETILAIMPLTFLDSCAKRQ